MKKLRYRHIRAWGSMMGSFDYYIKAEVEAATADKTPETAIYKDRDSGKWSTYDKVTNAATRYTMDNILKDIPKEVDQWSKA